MSSAEASLPLAAFVANWLIALCNAMLVRESFRLVAASPDAFVVFAPLEREESADFAALFAIDDKAEDFVLDVLFVVAIFQTPWKFGFCANPNLLKIFHF